MKAVSQLHRALIVCFLPLYRSTGIRFVLPQFGQLIVAVPFETNTFSDLTGFFSEIACGIIKAPFISACSILLPFGDTLT